MCSDSAGLYVLRLDVRGGGSRLRDICTGSKRSVDMAERTGRGINC